MRQWQESNHTKAYKGSLTPTLEVLKAQHKLATQTMLGTPIGIYRKVCEEMTGQIQDISQILTIGSIA